MSDTVQRERTEVERERERMEAQREHNRQAELHRTYFEAASKSAEVAVKTSVVVNGGAAVAVLAFIGGLLGKDIVTVKQVADVSGSLMWFALGVSAGITALAFIYLMNYSSAAVARWRKLEFEAPYVRDTSRTFFMRNVYTIAHIIAVMISLLSVVFFVSGVLDVKNSITQLANTISSGSNIKAPKSFEN